MGTSNLSGAKWWRDNERFYPNSRDLGDLDPGFGADVKRFVGSLIDAGANVAVMSTRRNATRAHLMHYSWKVANGQIAPSDVPKKAGLVIEWDHGGEDASRKAAQAMVDLFGMVHIASLTSNHIKGLAIDMTIKWKGDLRLTSPAPLNMIIEDGPRSGQNRQLHDIGATVFGVRKLLSDPPHWSRNGR